jgi:hypothetical protein
MKKNFLKYFLIFFVILKNYNFDQFILWVYILNNMFFQFLVIGIWNLYILLIYKNDRFKKK